MDFAVETPRHTNLRVFVVEDRDNVLSALKDLVDALGNARIVGVAASEAVAADWARSHPEGWDVAIVDLLLDQGNGFNVVEQLKQQPCAGRVAVYSGYLTEVIKRHCRALGADEVFYKTESRELAAYVERLALTGMSATPADGSTARATPPARSLRRSRTPCP